jgi:hypothetical protein
MRPRLAFMVGHPVRPRLIDFGHEALVRLLGPLIPGVLLARRNFDFDRCHVVIRDLPKQMRDAIESCPLLVIGVDDVPWGLLAVCVG